MFTDGTSGSSILGYNLQVKDTFAGNFRDVVGGDSLNTLRSIYDLQGDSIQKGTSYSFRYRVYNLKGWSSYSDITIIEAADVPSQPDLLSIVSSSSTEIELEFNFANVDNNGSPITSYEL